MVNWITEFVMKNILKMPPSQLRSEYRGVKGC